MIRRHTHRPLVAHARRAALLVCAALALAVASAPLWLSIVGRWLALPGAPRYAQAIIVHGGGQARTDYGVALYHRGMAPELWHTGYARGEQRITADAVELGRVPRNAFRYLATTTTWTDGTQIAAAIRERKLHSVLIVTDWWHSRRALCALRAQLDGYDVTLAYAAAPAPFGPDVWWRDAATRASVLHELGGIVNYGLRYGMNPWGC